jgi:arabinogalactan oligomer/maltooligosaccharide transport system substrate-binding protein
MKHEWKKQEKEWYGAGPLPAEVTVPPFGFFVLEGRGDPNGPDFADRVGTLYALSYGVRMAPKGGLDLPGWFEYTVYPLEGVWDLGKAPAVPGVIDKSDLVYRIMIRQPAFVGADTLATVLDASRKKKKDLPHGDEVRFEVIEEKRCVQMLHTGSYDTETKSFGVMKDYCRKNSLARVGHAHREIYLSDPGKSAPEALKTILRFPVRDDFSCL